MMHQRILYEIYEQWFLNTFLFENPGMQVGNPGHLWAIIHQSPSWLFGFGHLLALTNITVYWRALPCYREAPVPFPSTVHKFFPSTSHTSHGAKSRSYRYTKYTVIISSIWLWEWNRVICWTNSRVHKIENGSKSRFYWVWRVTRSGAITRDHARSHNFKD